MSHDTASEERSSTRFTSGIVDEPKHVRLPITGYADGPLLSLEEACTPLMNIVKHLESHIWVAKQNSHEPTQGLTHDESAAIHLYTMEWGQATKSFYSSLNETLKATDRTLLRPWFKYLKLFITALAKLPFTARQTVWRGVTRNLSTDFPVGKEIIWWSFSSCTTSLRVLESDVYLGTEGERTLFSIDAFNGKCVREHSYFKTEDEILLLPGTVLEVQSQLNPAPGLYIIHLKQKYPETVLLEPPFEGAHLYPDENGIRITKKWFLRKRLIVFLLLIISLVLILALVFGLRSSSSSSSSSSTIPPTLSDQCSPRRPINISVDMFWSFDCSNSKNDLSNTSSYDGIGTNNPDYIIPDFSGQMIGAALSLRETNKQYVTIPYNGNFRKTSFSISAWIYPISIGDYGAAIFTNYYGRDTSSSSLISEITSNLSLGFLIGNKYIYSDQSISLSQWQHVAFVFNNQTLISSIYLNGYLTGKTQVDSTIDEDSEAVDSIIGYALYARSATATVESYYTGYIDQLSLAFRARNDQELLNEASLAVAYEFTDQTNIFNDSGPNVILANGENVFFQNSNSLLFNTSSSYFQSSNFTLLSMQNYSYSISFWVKAFVNYTDFVVSGGRLVPLIRLVSLNPSTSKNECVAILHLSQGILTMSRNIFSSSYKFVSYNVTLQRNQQYHIAYTYSGIEKNIRLYVDGQLIDLYSDMKYDSPIPQSDNNIPRLLLTLGSISNPKDDSGQYRWLSSMCNWGGVNALKNGLYFIEFNGTMSDVRMYSRILTQTDIQMLFSTNSSIN